MYIYTHKYPCLVFTAPPGMGGYPLTHPPHPPPAPHPQGGEGYIDICIHIIYMLYTFAHTHTTYVYTRLCVYIQYNIYTHIHTV